MDGIYSPLTVPDTGPDADRLARLYDTLRHNIRLHEFDNYRTRPGFYIYRDEVVEVFRQAAPIAQQPIAAATSLYDLPPVLPEIAGFSSVQPPQSLPTVPQNLRSKRTAELHMRPADPAEVRRAQPRAYMMDLAFGQMGAGGITWDGQQVLGCALKFKGMIDMGSCANVWMYSTYGGVQEIHPVHKTCRALSESGRSYNEFLNEKSKILYTHVADVSERIQYANGVIVDVRPVTRLCGIFDYHRVLSTFIPDFTLGAAVGFTASALDYPFDGIIGLGRSHPGTSALRTQGVLQQLITQHRIQEEQIYVCCRYDASNKDFGYGFVSFGGWPSGVPGRPPRECWTSVAIDPSADDGRWVVYLEEMIIELHGKNPSSFEIKRRVLLDNATFHTVIPSLKIDEMETYLGNCASTKVGGVPALLKNAKVMLVFSSTVNGVKTLHSVRGSATKFFLVPTSIGAGHGNEAESTLASLEATSTNGESSLDQLAILGLNFFRTFYVAFIDHAATPGIMLAAQK